MPTLPSPEQTGSRSGQLRISPWAQEVGRPCGYEGHQAGLQLHMPSKHIVFTQFWGSAGRGRTHGNSGGPTASPAIPTLPLGYITLVITLLLKSLRGSPVLLGQIQIPAWGAQGLPPTLSAFYLIPPPLLRSSGYLCSCHSSNGPFSFRLLGLCSRFSLLLECSSPGSWLPGSLFFFCSQLLCYLLRESFPDHSHEISSSQLLCYLS